MRTIYPAVLLLTFVSGSALAQPAAEYPVPVSERAEKIGPTTMAFLTYPKYYRGPDGELTEVITSLVESPLEDWDYEVTTGIWTLRVRTDGTFQASHEGNVFTYRLADLGLGSGDSFRSLELNSPRWEEYQVMGDSILWKDVFPDVDLSVRYVHDTLKVDVLLREPLVERLRSQVGSGSLEAEGFLTARFEIPQVVVTSDVRQGGEPRDLYGPPVTVDRPLEFVRDGEVIHVLRPVEAFVLDERGWPVESSILSMETAQLWRLYRDGAGVAEMSVRLADLAAAPPGDISIDPTTTFSPASRDSLLDYNNQDTNYGSTTTLHWSVTNDRYVFGFDVSSLGSDKTINSATLSMYVSSSGYTNLDSRSYRVEESWEENYVTWNDRDVDVEWSTAGGTITSPTYQSPVTVIPAYGSGVWVEYDVTDAFKVHYLQAGSRVSNRGFLIKPVETMGPNDFVYIRSSEYGTTSQRPKLIVSYDHTRFGADAGNACGGVNDIDSRQDAMKEDNLDVIRFFTSDATFEQLDDFMSAASGNDMHVIMEMPCGPIRPSGVLDDGYDEKQVAAWIDDERPGGGTGYARTASGYAEWVEHRLDAVSGYIDGTTSRTIIGVEIGNEEDAYFPATVSGVTHTWVRWPSDTPAASEIDYGYPDHVDWATSTICYEGGKDFAEFYKAAKDRIDDRWPNLYVISGGSVVDYDTLSAPDDDHTAGVGRHAGAFIAGFIDGVTEQSGGALSKLPDFIAIHGYTDLLPAEGQHHTGLDGDREEWLVQLDYLSDRCSRGGYSPDFAVTESGFIQGVTETLKQPVYYMRRCLIDATNRSGSTGPPYLHSLYFHHPKSPLWAGGLGAMHDSDGNPRATRKVARMLQAKASGQNPYPELGLEGTEIWIPAKTDRTGGDDGENIMTCGWETESGQKWGAIWRYVNNDQSYWQPATGEAKNFVVEGEDLRPLKAYRYQFSGLSSYSTVSFGIVSQTGIDGTYSGGNTTYSIPNVTENPTFLRFAE